MTEDEVIELGEYAEDLLSQDYFSVLIQQYTMQRFTHFTATEAKSTKEREGIYNQMRALEDFVGHMKAVVTQKNTILQARELSEEDAQHIEGID